MLTPLTRQHNEAVRQCEFNHLREIQRQQQLKRLATEAGAAWSDPTLEEAAIRFANRDEVGAEVALLTALQMHQGPPESAQLWASALFDLYRLTGQAAAFDRIALDHARRFGRSAPAWFSLPDLLAPPCVKADCVLSGEALDGGSDPLKGASTMTDRLDQMSAALRGELLGDASVALNQLQAGHAASPGLSISCALLVRVDFSAAGSLLDWLILREAQGCRVQFLDVPLLVAAFFNVIGINQHAGILRRTR